ncbi:aminotransferase [Boletus edulis]|nr:aminotransferase [Boletus edulis]
MIKPNGYAETPCGVRAHEPEGPEESLARLDISKLTIRLTDAPKPLPDLKTLVFGVSFSDHMATTSFHPATGWSTPEIKPYAPFTLDPASSCFQYGCNVFEGMKVRYPVLTRRLMSAQPRTSCMQAYLGPDSKARLFRPELNMRRLERSMERLALPPINGDAVLELIKRFVQIEKRWIPKLPGYSLYLRPTVIGTRAELGPAASDQAVLYIIACPSGPYWSHPASLLAMSDTVRAWPGGTGGHKVGGNYSPGFLPQREASAQGYNQVLWLFGEEQRVMEAGVMNVFVVVRRADGDGLDVLTPPLDGMILPGVTRASCLELAADPTFHAHISIDGSIKGTTLYPVERVFTLSDLERWSTSGDLVEFLCVGTAAVVAAVHDIGFDGRVVVRVPTYPDDPNGLGPVGRALREQILAVQEGRKEYKGWGVVCE